jgi:hypothetical protein
VATPPQVRGWARLKAPPLPSRLALVSVVALLWPMARSGRPKALLLLPKVPQVLLLLHGPAWKQDSGAHAQ